MKMKTLSEELMILQLREISVLKSSNKKLLFFLLKFKDLDLEKPSIKEQETNSSNIKINYKWFKVNLMN